MNAGLQWALKLAGVGLFAGFALVVAFFGTGELLKRQDPGNEADHAGKPLAELPHASKPDANKSDADSAGLGTGYRATLDSHGELDPLSQDETGLGKDLHGGAASADPAKGPRLDIVRIEPSGDAVIAGRATPNAVVEILRDNQPIARIDADATGQFAILPPALPSGNSELTLRMTGRDGTSITGRESVAVVIAPDRNAKPLVAVSEPDKPTRVLSQPEATADARIAAKAPDTIRTEAGKGEKTAKPEAQVGGIVGKPSQRMAALPEPGAKADGPGSSVKIVSVDAQEGGRLHVTGQATAWTALRLYLNDTMVASGQSDAQGRIAFTIGRGVRPGGYQIRVDQVDAQTGKVRNRAQVAFAYPTNLAERGGGETLAAPAAAPVPGQARHGAAMEVAQAPMAATPQPGAKPSGSAAAPPSGKPVSEPADSAPPAAADARMPDPASRMGEAGPGAGAEKVRAPSAGTDGFAKTAKEMPAKETEAKLAEKQRAPTDTPSIAIASGKPEAKPSLEASQRAAAALAPSLPEPAGGLARSEGSAAAPASKSEVAQGQIAQGKVPEIKEMAVLPAPAPAQQAGAVFVPEISTAKITRGDNLWQISRRTYGNGQRYTVIYDANQDQIRDPDLIYPGQIFVLPKGGPESERARTKRG